MSYPRKTISHLSENEIDEIISLYDSGVSASEIGERFAMSNTSILKIIKLYSKINTSRSVRVRKFKKIDVNYFDNVDTEEKAYFLGLLYADGCNSITPQRYRYNISIALQEEDKEILEKFKDRVTPESKIRQINPKRVGRKILYQLDINNKYMSEKLCSLGLVPRKSLILKFPQWLVNYELQRHFIRGYYDGDGSIFQCTKGKNAQVKFNLVSTFDFCSSVKHIIEKACHVKIRLDVTGNGITTYLSCAGNKQVMRIMQWLYADSSMYMLRKYARWKEFSSFI